MSSGASQEAFAPPAAVAARCAAGPQTRRQRRRLNPARPQPTHHNAQGCWRSRWRAPNRGRCDPRAVGAARRLFCVLARSLLPAAACGTQPMAPAWTARQAARPCCALP